MLTMVRIKQLNKAKNVEPFQIGVEACFSFCTIILKYLVVFCSNDVSTLYNNTSLGLCYFDCITNRKRKLDQDRSIRYVRIHHVTTQWNTCN